MKVIELLNKIAKGEIPKTIVYDERYFTYDEKKQNYFSYDDSEIDWKYTVMEYINDEVEIIEEHNKATQEHKIPEKLIPTSLRGIDNLDEKIEVAHVDTISAIDKINEIIDYLEVNNDGKR